MATVFETECVQGIMQDAFDLVSAVYMRLVNLFIESYSSLPNFDVSSIIWNSNNRDAWFGFDISALYNCDWLKSGCFLSSVYWPVYGSDFFRGSSWNFPLSKEGFITWTKCNMAFPTDTRVTNLFSIAVPLHMLAWLLNLRYEIIPNLPLGRTSTHKRS